MVIVNFKEVDNYTGEIISRMYDERNGITCINADIQSLDTYYNYLNLLNKYKDRWRNVGLLDYGMIPVWMAPSFMHAALTDSVVDLLNQRGIPFHLATGTSLLLEKQYWAVKDIWVDRKVAAGLVGCGEFEVTTEKFLRRLIG